MFDIGWSEILVIVIITILVVGPKELPGLLRTIGKTVSNLRRMAGDFQHQFNDALKEAELDDVQKSIGDIRKLNPSTAVKDAVKKQLSSVDDLSEDLSSQMAASKSEINEALNTDGAASGEPSGNSSSALQSDVGDLTEDHHSMMPPELVEPEAEAVAVADVSKEKEAPTKKADE